MTDAALIAIIVALLEMLFGDALPTVTVTIDATTGQCHAGFYRGPPLHMLWADPATGLLSVIPIAQTAPLLTLPVTCITREP